MPPSTPPCIRLPHAGESFFGYDVAPDLAQLDADIAILGIPVGFAYSRRELYSDQSTAPQALRAATSERPNPNPHYDFDVDGTVLDGQAIKIVDCGDVIVDETVMAATSLRAEACVRQLLSAGALPIIIGGDHSVPIPVLRAFDQAGPDEITIIQIDAHMDWRDEVGGVKEGYSSPMRRLSEMRHVGAFFQIGIRGQGSARGEEIEAAKRYGSNIVTAYDVHDRGIEAVLEKIPAGGKYYITLDADGMDPAVMPAVGYPAPGGLTFHQLRTLLTGLVHKGRVVGMDIVEITPSRDLNGITLIAASRIINILVGEAVRAGYFRR